LATARAWNAARSRRRGAELAVAAGPAGARRFTGMSVCEADRRVRWAAWCCGGESGRW